MNSKKHFMAVALWILATAAVAADKPPQASTDSCSCNGSTAGAHKVIQHIEHMLQERS